MTQRSTVFPCVCRVRRNRVSGLMLAPQAWACYGVPCSPTVCDLAGVGAAHTTHTTADLRSQGPGLRTCRCCRTCRWHRSAAGREAACMAGPTRSRTTSTPSWAAPMGRPSSISPIPRNPKYVANLPKVAGSADTSWREPKVYQNTVYVGVDGTSVGMQVMDLTKLRTYTGTTLTLTSYSVYNKRHPHPYAGDQSQHPATSTPRDQVRIDRVWAVCTSSTCAILRPLPSSPSSMPMATRTMTQVVTYNGPDATYQGHELAFNSNGNVRLEQRHVQHRRCNQSRARSIASRPRPIPTPSSSTRAGSPRTSATSSRTIELRRARRRDRRTYPHARVGCLRPG
jgi:hypothetical protein